jgi:hypothetical protein
VDGELCEDEVDNQNKGKKKRGELSCNNTILCYLCYTYLTVIDVSTL